LVDEPGHAVQVNEISRVDIDPIRERYLH